jgi:RecG-like helicase
MYEATRALLPDLRWGLLHGQLPPAEKTAVMQRFAPATSTCWWPPR